MTNNNNKIRNYAENALMVSAELNIQHALGLDVGTFLRVFYNEHKDDIKATLQHAKKVTNDNDTCIYVSNKFDDANDVSYCVLAAFNDTMGALIYFDRADVLSIDEMLTLYSNICGIETSVVNISTSEINEQVQ